ncbi:GxxExxY protein [Patescibacteria group bacterium]|nr:GxxExxY protein [Patescibacteria group bacterium]
MEYKLKRNDLVYPDLCFTIVGILFDVYNTIGAGYREKTYQEGIALGFKKNGIAFQKEAPADLIVFSEKLGRYYLDFVVEEKIVIEVKRGSRFSKRDIEQIKAYLKIKKLKLGILALFGAEEMKFVRIINWELVEK